MRLLLRLSVISAHWLWVATLVAVVAITVFAVGLMTRLDNSTDMADVVAEYTGIPTSVPERPVFVTPLGIAMNDRSDEDRE